MHLFMFLGICFPLNVFALSAPDTFTEELYIKPLQTGHVYNHFKFTTKWDINADDENSFTHFRLFPKSLGEIISKYSVQELHLSLTQGLWRHRKWGYPVQDTPSGAELWVWFKDDTENVDVVWKDLTNALSGQFCASLNFIDKMITVSPKWSFRPRGIHNNAANSSFLRYAALPNENVCTENLTPWKKLLPCGSKEGLSTLLNAGKLFNSQYNSLSVNIRPICRNVDCVETSLELSQSVDVVLEPLELKKGKMDWSLFQLFGIKIMSSCSVSSNSTVLVDVTANKNKPVFSVTPSPSSDIRSNDAELGKDILVYDVAEIIRNTKEYLNIAAKYKSQLPLTKIHSPPLFAHRYIAGLGQERGEIRCQIYNLERKNLTIVYQEVIPWFIRIYMSKLRITSRPQDHRLNYRRRLQPEYIHYKPGKDRQLASHVELIVTLPPLSVTEVGIEFERGFLKWTEHPPDANHGFYINSAVVSAVLTSSQNYTSVPISSSTLSEGYRRESGIDGYFVRIHTETLLVSLPVPDFSMPYNVICLSCTVVALAFGPLHNITTKRLTAIDPDTKKGIFNKLKSFLKKLKCQSNVEETEDALNHKLEEMPKEDQVKT